MLYETWIEVKQRGPLCGFREERANVAPHTQEAPLMRLSVASLRRVVKGDLRIEFVRQELTSYGGLELLRRYTQRINLLARLRAAGTGLGGDYGTARLALLIMALFYVAARRLEHLRYVAED